MCKLRRKLGTINTNELKPHKKKLKTDQHTTLTVSLKYSSKTGRSCSLLERADARAVGLQESLPRRVAAFHSVSMIEADFREEEFEYTYLSLYVSGSYY